MAVAMLIAARLPGLLGMAPHGAGRIVVRAAPAAVAASVVAAVAEEAFFRRLVYGWLASSWGAAVAICGSAVAFAAIHVPFSYHFTGHLQDDFIALTDITLYGDGTVSRQFRWTQ